MNGLPIPRRSQMVIAALLLVSLFAPASAVSAQQDTHCGAGQTPRFTLGFAALKTLVGTDMGDPLTCEFALPEGGGTQQLTTTGQAVWRKSTNTPTFSNRDLQHWALTDLGLAAWTGSSTQPPVAVPAPASAITNSLPHAMVAPPPDDMTFWCLARNESCLPGKLWWTENYPNGTTDQVQFPTIGAGLTSDNYEIEAIWLLWQMPAARNLLRAAADGNVPIYTYDPSTLPPDDPRVSVSGGYDTDEHTIAINLFLARRAPTWMVASILVHELQHALDDRVRSPEEAGMRETCYVDEVNAATTQVQYLRWLQDRFSGLPTPGDLEAAGWGPSYQRELADELELMNAPDLNALVRGDPVYVDQCGSLPQE